MQCPRCRAALPAGSLFCNSCGLPMGSATGQPSVPPGAQPGGQPSQAFPTQRPYGSAPPPGEVTQHPGAPAYPGVQPVPQYAAAPPPGVVPANPKKPVLLLTAALVALALGVAGICGVMWKSTHGSAVVSGGAPVVPLGPGVEQTAGANAPVGAPLTATQGAPVPAGSPVTASAKKPDDGMAPSVLASGATNPRGGSGVTTVQGVPTPNGPAVVSAAPPAQQPGAPVTAARPPAPPDNSDFDRYLRWLQYVEQERERLRAMGETESFRMIDGFYQTMFSLADPDSNDAQVQQQFNQNLQGSLQRSLQTIRAFRQNVMKTKPPVPPDCGALDRYYMAAVDEESQQTVALMDALGRKDIGQVKAIGKAGVRNIDRNLGMANKELEKAYRGRGLNQQFTIDTGSGSSMLGGMIGLGGVH